MTYWILSGASPPGVWCGRPWPRGAVLSCQGGGTVLDDGAFPVKRLHNRR